MKVVFDAYWWVSGPPSLRHVLREIVLSWSELYPEDELTLVVRRSQLAEAAVDAPANSTLRGTALWPQAYAASRAGAAAARSVDADLVLTHNFAAPGRSSARRTLSAIYLHDVLFATNPEWFTPIERLYFSRMLRWIRRADLVFSSTVSEGRRIAENSNARIVLPVGLGLSTELTTDGLPEDPDPLLTSRSFVLTVGRLNARKNLGTVIDAALASGRISRDRPLVVVGSADGKRAALGSDAERAIADGIVRFTGFTTEARLRWYYRNTSLFVFLSLGEGFGMPPVEAAYFSATILVSDLPIFHETLGGHANYVDPTDLPAAAAAIARGIDTGESREAPLRARTSIATQHDWHETVRAMRSAVVDQLEGVRA